MFWIFVLKYILDNNSNVFSSLGKSFEKKLKKISKKSIDKYKYFIYKKI